VRLYPLYHPAAALYTPSMLEMLRSDFLRIPEILAIGAPAQPEPIDSLPELDEEPVPELDEEPVSELAGGPDVRGARAGREPEPAAQLGLF
jgi:DNA polymerase